MEVGDTASKQSISTSSTPLPPPNNISRSGPYSNLSHPTPPPLPTMATTTILQPTSHYQLYAPHPSSMPYPLTAGSSNMSLPPSQQPPREHVRPAVESETPRHALPSIKEMLAPERASSYTAAATTPLPPPPVSQTHNGPASSLAATHSDRLSQFQPTSHMRPRINTNASRETSPRSVPATSPVECRRPDTITAYSESLRPPLHNRHTGPPPPVTSYPSHMTSMPPTPRHEAHFHETRQYETGPSSARSEASQQESYHTATQGSAQLPYTTASYGYTPRHIDGPHVPAGFADLSRPPSLAHDNEHGKESATFQHTMTRLHNEWDYADQFNQIAQAARTVFNFADGYSRSVADEPGPHQQRPRKMPSEREIGEIAKTAEYMRTMVEYVRNETQQRAQHERVRELNRSKAVYEEEESGLYDSGTMKAPYEMKRKRGRAAPPGRCHSCNRMDTPEWRRGPDGARTLCNACGLHYAKLERKKQVDAKSGRSRHLDERS